MSTTQYIGARYVPLFADPAEWNDSRTYEPLTIVLHEGNSYTSRQFVPKGITIDNDDFWALTGNYNAQVEQYRQDVARYATQVNSVSARLNTEITRATAAEQKLTTDLEKCICSFDSIESFKNCNRDFKENDYVLINGLVYKITNDNANEMDIIKFSENKSATLQIYNYVKPEYLGYVQNSSEDASVYINRSLEIARNKANVILSGVYRTKTPIHMSYNDCIYGVGRPKIIAAEYPIISFDIDTLVTYERNSIPFNGDSIIIMNKDLKVDDADDTHNAIILKNASELTIKGLNIYYTGAAVSIEGANNYCIKFTDCLIERNYIGIKYNSNSNSGERISFDNVIFGHCYYAIYLKEPTASINYINCSFDFCSTGIYSLKPNNDAFNFNGCHIEGMGYTGNDMPKKETDEYSIFIYNAGNTQYTISKYVFTSCFFHYQAMQDIIGIPLLVHNKFSETYLNGCINSVKKLDVITKYPISTGVCPIGMFNANVLQTGDNYLPKPIINGPYITYKENESVKINKRTVSDPLFDTLFNYPYLTVNGETNNFLIDLSIEGDSGNLIFNGYYSFNFKGINRVRLNEKLNVIKFNITSDNTVFTVKGIWFI